jgi:hypothetical protein
MKALLDTIPQVGTVGWIGLRPGRREAMTVVNRVLAAPRSGLDGDRYQDRGGINLLALKDKRIRIGDVEMEVTGLCHPCSRMEELLGYEACY